MFTGGWGGALAPGGICPSWPHRYVEYAQYGPTGMWNILGIGPTGIWNNLDTGLMFFCAQTISSLKNSSATWKSDTLEKG